MDGTRDNQIGRRKEMASCSAVMRGGDGNNGIEADAVGAGVDVHIVPYLEFATVIADLAVTSWPPTSSMVRMAEPYSSQRGTRGAIPARTYEI